MTVRRASRKDAWAVTALALLLWPGHDMNELFDEIAGCIESESGDTAVLVAVDDGGVQGFAQCSLRRDYVEGTRTSPVGYLEGVFVSEAARRQGMGRALAEACEAWAVERGCAEFASDCELRNTLSVLFHRALGFREANRIVCFAKKLPQ